ncbi:hypothetical protein [Hanstruepera marina]|uniref:hypothetical protein n=1 Tax=Hanstruepera marina TaxID=2873265 RepID=UPI001CA7A5A4|nr:hypothetical protein [Hanstruepera marina]
MKNAHNFFVLMFFTALFFSCTPSSIDEDHPNQTIETYGTGDDQSGEVDNDRDEDGD